MTSHKKATPRGWSTLSVASPQTSNNLDDLVMTNQYAQRTEVDLQKQSTMEPLSQSVHHSHFNYSTEEDPDNNKIWQQTQQDG